MIPLFDAAVLTLSAGRVSYSIARDEIFRPAREWVYHRSAPSDDVITKLEGGQRVGHDARLYHKGELDFSVDPRKPGFFGEAISCFYCNSLYVSVAWLLAYALSAHWTIIALLPFALWSAATLLAKELSK